MKKTTATQLREVMADYMKRHGLKMTKQISSGGFFSDPTWDNRTVYSLQELSQLNKEGFSIDVIDLGLWLFNAFNTTK